MSQAKRKVVYVVIENTPGCMPESEPESFTRKQDAIDHMHDLAEELREAGYSVTGDARRDGCYQATRRGSQYDLGRVVELNEFSPEEARAMGYEIEDEEREE